MGKEFEKRDEKAEKSSQEHFSIINTNKCLKDCKKLYFYTFKRTNKYFSEDKGFFIESSMDYI